MRTLFKHSFYGFIIGGGVALLIILCLFLSLGSVGLTSPMIAVIFSLFCILGAMLGYQLNLFNEKIDPATTQLQQLQLPLIAYAYGALTSTLTYWFCSARGFWLSVISVFIVCTLSMIYLYRKIQPNQVNKNYRSSMALTYLSAGVIITLLYAYLCQSFEILAVGLIFTLVSTALVAMSLTPPKPLPQIPLRPYEIEIIEVLTPTLAQEAIKKPQKNAYKTSVLFLGLIFLIVLCAGISYFSFPWVSMSLWRYIGANCISLLLIIIVFKLLMMIFKTKQQRESASC